LTPRLAVAAVAALLVAVGAWLLRPDDPGPAARVNGVVIEREEVAAAIGHAAARAVAEGRAFPARGSDDYRVLERQALDLLVYHEELEQEARRLGVRVDTDEVDARLAAARRQQPAANDEGEVADEAFLRDGIRGSLLYARIYARVTSAKSGRAAKNAAMARWVAAMRARYADRVEYAGDFRGG
jgi:SurA N-terminal domain